MSVRWECPNAECRRAGTALDSIAAPSHCPACGARLAGAAEQTPGGRAPAAAAVLFDSRVPKRPPSPHDPEHNQVSAAVVLLIFLVFGGMMVLALLLAIPRAEVDVQTAASIASIPLTPTHEAASQASPTTSENTKQADVPRQ